MRTVKTDKGEITYDDDMPVGILRGLFSSAQSGDIDLLIKALSGIVKEWYHDGDPTDDKEWDSLKLSEFQYITSTVMSDLGGLGEA
jgi:hypothetical protein